MRLGGWIRITLSLSGGRHLVGATDQLPLPARRDGLPQRAANGNVIHPDLAVDGMCVVGLVGPRCDGAEGIS